MAIQYPYKKINQLLCFILYVEVSMDTGHLWVKYIKEFFFEFFMTKLECFRRFEECQQSRANDLLKDSSWKPIRIVKMKEGFGDGSSEKIIYVLANETPA